MQQLQKSLQIFNKKIPHVLLLGSIWKREMQN